MSTPVDPWPGLFNPEGPGSYGGFRSSDKDTDYGDTRNTRVIAVEAAEATKKIEEDLTFIKERIHELVDETSTHEEQRASLEKRLAALDPDLTDGPYKPTIPNQDLFALDVDKLIHDLGDVFRTEKEMREKDWVDRDHINVIAAHVGHVLWEHLRLPSELYDAWVEATDCGLDKK